MSREEHSSAVKESLQESNSQPSRFSTTPSTFAPGMPSRPEDRARNLNPFRPEPVRSSTPTGNMAPLFSSSTRRPGFLDCRSTTNSASASPKPPRKAPKRKSVEPQPKAAATADKV
eukprot:CAMPEP_0175985020 /NCGR_PEP_ID=MMETSP0108-20121206/49323_1 /TAXON_ID=195067 ORGANISM="Goniomonas pacifica, Strain CCMP1869" /NCGR_SAMPLE_ID=MMETSP0108 /ASSEMBLY_ACC=CAM_ASM_000204 /LENGTH=115 /DNA_ID=CAMNT_0017315943 /DNA_START=82 /DNA_END=426 /DNA_ORIENTATION=+